MCLRVCWGDPEIHVPETDELANSDMSISENSRCASLMWGILFCNSLHD